MTGKKTFLWCLLVLNIHVIANTPTDYSNKIKKSVVFIENKNQWPAQVVYKSSVGNGTTIYFEKNKFTFTKYNPLELQRIHQLKHNADDRKKIKDEKLNVHAFNMNLIGTNEKVEINAANKESYYHNYFIGNNPSKWASNVGVYKEITYQNIYPNINLHAYVHENKFKYDFIVKAETDPSQIKMTYEGINNLKIENNKLIITTSAGEIIQDAPFTYQIIDGEKKEVKCEYRITNFSTVDFVFPNSFNKNYALIIDPTLVGASYSGANQDDVFGHCATYDNSGNIYTGGESFGFGYPTTTGAYQTSFQGGSTDMAISKLNPNATNLIWATYIGGSGDEVPNSMFVNTSGELYILGASDSPNFPCSAGAYDNSHNGLCDITITHLNATATSLVGSTYIGGTGNEGGNFTFSTVPWTLNFHDPYRGEIIVDASNNAWIASYTNSSAFPTTTGAYDQSFNGPGTYDACIFRLSSNLSTLQWSTFLGGTGADGAYGLRLSTTNELYVTGATTSSNFPTTAGSYAAAYLGGTSDGYVARFNSTGSSLLSSTFFGTNQDDVSYFIDLNVSDEPYIYGVSTGNITVSAGVYNNAGSTNFVSKFNTALTTLSFSTVFGDGTSTYLEPGAFMVDRCGNIYMSGFNSTNSYPTTSNALFTTQPITFDDDNCYFIVLSANAASLLYGTFYYGWHVDGGTSRFDPQGVIYQAMCIGSGAASATPGAWSTSSFSTPDWDTFVVKIDFQFVGVNAAASASANDTVCVGSNITFTNSSTNATGYVWNFGDGSPTSTATTPSHTYNTVGTYTVTLIANNTSSTACVGADTTQFPVYVVLANVTATPAILSCINNTAVLSATSSISNVSYAWQGIGIVSGGSTSTPTVNTAGTYTVTISLAGTNCTATTTVTVSPPSSAFASVSPDVIIQSGQSTTLTATGGGTYLWFPSTGLNTTTGATVVSTPAQTTTYCVEVTNNGCTDTACVKVTIENCPSMDNIQVPNVFSPNNDGRNDKFYLAGWDLCFSKFDLVIYNRWGIKIFESTSSNVEWDGRITSGAEAVDGTYYYIFDLKNNRGEQKKLAGFVSLIR